MTSRGVTWARSVVTALARRGDGRSGVAADPCGIELVVLQEARERCEEARIATVAAHARLAAAETDRAAAAAAVDAAEANADAACAVADAAAGRLARCRERIRAQEQAGPPDAEVDPR